MRGLKQLFDNNRRWAANASCARIRSSSANCPGQQSPGLSVDWLFRQPCAANDIVGLLPGELFVHRNVANLVVHTDLNCLSVMQFAVDILQGAPYHCMRALWLQRGRRGTARDRIGLSDNWLRHVQDVRQKHEDSVNAAGTEVAAGDRLCELNVIEQVANVCQTTIARDAWERGQLRSDGWVYGLKDGLLRDLNTSVAQTSEVATGYKTALAALQSG